MFENSLKYLRTDYVDYLLLHAVGGGGLDNLHARYLDNGVLKYLQDKREEGVIRISVFLTTEISRYSIICFSKWTKAICTGTSYRYS